MEPKFDATEEVLSQKRCVLSQDTPTVGCAHGANTWCMWSCCGVRSFSVMLWGQGLCLEARSQQRIATQVFVYLVLQMGEQLLEVWVLVSRSKIQQRRTRQIVNFSVPRRP